MAGIPAWDDTGVIPPVRPGKWGNDPDRAPYSVDVVELVQHFATSSERCTILEKLLEYRTALKNAGIESGFQWLNGSFMENKEEIHGGVPNDIDVVTFLELPSGTTEQELASRRQDLVDPPVIRSSYGVDGYIVVLGCPCDDTMVKWISYWYSMWSHRRHDHRWKGFVRIDLASDDDLAARKHLEFAREDEEE